MNRSYCFHQHISSFFPATITSPCPRPFRSKCLMSVSSTCTLCTWHRRSKVKSLFSFRAASPAPHALSVTCRSLRVHAGSCFLKAERFWRIEFRLGRLRWRTLRLREELIRWLFRAAQVGSASSRVSGNGNVEENWGEWAETKNWKRL